MAGKLTPRVAEVYGGMLNAVGLQNPELIFLWSATFLF